MSSSRRRRAQSGMSIVEVLVSIAIVGSLIVLYAAAFNVSTLSRTMRSENLAYHIASKRMEELRNMDYAALPASGTFSDPLMASLTSGAGSYTRANYSTYTGMQELVVTVTWFEGRSRSVQVRTIVGTGGINP